MEVQEDNEYLVELEKLMTSEVATTLWANNMDLLALITFDNLIQLYRISYKAQLVFQVPNDKVVKGLAFSPDSQFLACGLNDGSVIILRSQNGEQILSLDGAHSTEVQTLTFASYCSLDSTTFMPFQKNSLESKLILTISPHKNCNRNAIVKINYFTELKKQFTLLLSSQKTKTLFLLNGFIPLAEIDYMNLAFQSPKVYYSHYDGKIRAIVGEQKSVSTELWLLQSDAGVIEEWKQPLIQASCLLSYISEVFSFAQTAYSAAEVIIRDALRQYNSKMNLIDDSNISDLKPCQQLFKFLNCGSTSTALVNFFTKEVYDTKILEKLDQTLNGLFAQLHDLLLQSIQNSLERASLLLTRLKDLSNGPFGPKLGLNADKLKRAEDQLIRLYTMGEVLLVESTEAKFDIRNLLVWLNKATIKSAGENQAQIQNCKSYLNKYTVDFNRLHGFLIQQKKFKLQNLLNYFSKDNSSFTLDIQKPDFKLFKKDKVQEKTPQQVQTFNKLALLFEVENITVPKHQPMQTEEFYRNFKVEMKELKESWKDLAKQPVNQVSSTFFSGWKKTQIGTVQESQLFPFQLKTVIKDNQLFAYFIEREEEKDRIVEFNCHTYQKGSVISIQSHIETIAVADTIITVLENKYTGKKIVAQVGNDILDGSQLVIGKRITRVEGELDIDCSLRGLNSLIIDKNKLIVFD